ncbi:MAG: hypothetical protein GX456_12880 [Verrucomicrobia bacterium]|nr:hypothetical protein [Verrucomicrobiota bacterium]
MRTAIIAALLLACCCYVSARIVKTVGTRFSFSVPLELETGEIRAHLPSGRYIIVLSTNFNARTFGMIPKERDYSAQIIIQVEAERGIVAHGTNVHYLVFSLSNEEAGGSECGTPFTKERRKSS